MNDPPMLSIQIEAWTREAVERWGDDWPRISQHIEWRMTSLKPKARRELAQETALTLAGVEQGAKH